MVNSDTFIISPSFSIYKKNNLPFLSKKVHFFLTKNSVKYTMDMHIHVYQNHLLISLLEED